MASEKKEGDKETVNKPNVVEKTNIETNTRVIDVIQMMNKWKYIPKDRFVKWSNKIKQEDLEYLQDLMGLNMATFDRTRSRFSVKLYDVLRQIKSSISMIRVQFITSSNEINGGLPYKDLEGYYVDSGYRQNGQQAYVKVPQTMNKKQRIIYATVKNPRWGFHSIDGAENQWAWIKSVENAQENKVTNKLNWIYYNSQENVKKFEPIKLYIKALNR
eukprot:484141_1